MKEKEIVLEVGNETFALPYLKPWNIHDLTSILLNFIDIDEFGTDVGINDIKIVSIK